MGGRGISDARVVVATVACVLALSSCGSSRAGEVDQVARALSASVAGDPAAACQLLAAATLQELEKSEEKPCSEALPELDVPDFGTLQSVAVYGLQAQVHFAAQTIFLTMEDGVWKVSALGCQPRPDDLPYECELQKG